MLQRRRLTLALFVGSTFAALAGCGSSQAAAPTRELVVVELFQSQGCSSCPPANADLNAIADRGDVLALSFAVTYWDRLGWKDTFGSPRFTARQQDYARAGRGEVATPEFIVNGTEAIVGSNPRALRTAIARAGAAPGAPSVSLDGASVRIGSAASRSPATVWLVRYDPRSRDVPIRAGENGGRTLPHRNIVRELTNLGNWVGSTAAFPIAAPRERGLATAVLIQRGIGGPIITARKL
jgi:hypothetical protein